MNNKTLSIILKIILVIIIVGILSTISFIYEDLHMLVYMLAVTIGWKLKKLFKWIDNKIL